MTTDAKLKDVLLKITEKNITAEKITDETTLIKDLGFDSLNMVELIVEIEEAFDAEIEDDDLDINTLNSYQSLKTLVENKLI